MRQCNLSKLAHGRAGVLELELRSLCVQNWCLCLCLCAFLFFNGIKFVCVCVYVCVCSLKGWSSVLSNTRFFWAAMSLELRRANPGQQHSCQLWNRSRETGITESGKLPGGSGMPDCCSQLETKINKLVLQSAEDAGNSTTLTPD